MIKEVLVVEEYNTSNFYSVNQKVKKENNESPVYYKYSLAPTSWVWKDSEEHSYLLPVIYHSCCINLIVLIWTRISN